MPKDDEKVDLSDPLKILDLLKDAILRKPVDKESVVDALRQVVKNYEQQNRIFMIAAANAELPRVVRLMSFINDCEQELFTPERVKDAHTKELVRMYALAQANILTSLDNVKKVADMRLDALRASGASKGIEGLLTGGTDSELSAIQDIPSLDPQSRDRVRKLITGLVDSIEKDDSVTENDDESAEDDTADKT